MSAIHLIRSSSHPAALVVKTEPASQDSLDDQVVAAMGCAHADAEVDFPVRGDVEVDRGEKLLLLIVQPVKAIHRTEGAVVFHAEGDLRGYVERNFCVGREFEAAGDIGAMQSAVECRIECQIPGPDFFIYDRANFPRPCIHRKFSALIPDL